MQAETVDLSGRTLAGRYELRGVLGRGGMGIVYRALDRRVGRELALKTLPRLADAESLYRLKQEFRVASRVHHPNLVALYDLDADGDLWFFTMDLVDGADLYAALRGTPPSREVVASTLDLTHLPSTPTPPTGVLEPAPPRAGFGPVMTAFSELADALANLHARGLVHRDVKPSNVLVGEDGRAVLLDLGLVAATAWTDLGGASMAQGLAGTPAYLAPEVIRGEPVTAAADVWAFGVTLYQVLVGRLPFSARWEDLVAPRDVFDRPEAVGVTVPEPLASVLQACLAVEPARRPTAEALCARLGGVVPSRPPEGPVPEQLVGRADDLARLAGHLHAVAAGEARVVEVRGASGIGKTAVGRRFAEEARARGALVLAGRCRADERIPFKALDAVVDDLARWLRLRDESELSVWEPDGLAQLVRVFPVLGRVGRWEAARVPDPEDVDPQARAFSAFRGLLRSIAQELPVVLWVDDAQWSDADSADALVALLRPPSPRVLVLLTARDHDRRLTAERVGSRAGVAAATWELEPLAPDAVADLLRLEAGDRAEAVSWLEAAVREAGGSPFLLRELAWRLHQPDRSVPGAAHDPWAARWLQLASEDARLLEAASVAGRPLTPGDLGEAADLGDAHRRARALADARLLRRVGDSGVEAYEPTHDRIRESVLARVSDARRQAIHAALAARAVQDAPVDAARVAGHLLAAGEADEALPWLVRAAEAASSALAFDLAVEHWRSVLDRAREADLRDRAERCLADSLAAAGHGVEAGRRFLSLADRATGHERLDLMRRGAQQVVFGGLIDEGLEVFVDLFAEVGILVPRSRWGLLAAMGARRGMLALRGRHWTARREEDLDAETRLRLDLLHDACAGLCMVDFPLGAFLQTLLTAEALRSGVPRRIAGALAMQAAFDGSMMASRADRFLRDLESARSLAGTLGEDPELAGLLSLMAAVIEWARGGFAEYERHARQAVRSLERAPGSLVWTHNFASILWLDGLSWTGQWAEMSTHALRFREDARRRGDLIAEQTVRLRYGTLAALAADDPERAHHGLDGFETWNPAGFRHHHAIELHNRVETLLYEGRPAEALARIEAAWPALEDSLLMGAMHLRVTMHHALARAALATAAVDPVRRGALLAMAGRIARRLEREGEPWTRLLGAILRMGMVRVEEGAAPSAELLVALERDARRASMGIHAAVLQWLRVTSVRPDAHQAEEVREVFATAGIQRPDRLVRVILPAL